MEYLCPLSKNRVDTNECYKQLALIEAGKGNKKVFFNDDNDQLMCDLHTCKANIECNLDDNVHHCTISDRISENSTTLADEYLHLINGYKAIIAEGI
jgi:hypothetical protein